MTPRPGPALDRLRADLRRIGYTTDGVQDFLGPVAAAALHREQPLPAERRCTGGEPLAVVIALFALGRPVAPEAVERALPTVTAAGLVQLGLVETADGRVTATCDLRPYGDERHDWWVASDLSELATGGPLRPDHVLGIGGASTTLASWTPRRPASRALDLGTGCGVQALHLSTHCGRVVATDISERACDYTRFNLALNEIDNVEVRHGSLFEPVVGERFDLVVSNPPFVITPRDAGLPEFEYRDGGMVGDDLVRTVVQSVGAHLTPGGVAQLLGNWEVRAGQDWTDVVRGWLAPTGPAAWVVQRETQDPAQYAELWSRDGGHRPGTPEHDRLYAAWLDDFAARGVESIGFGVLTLQATDDRFASFEEATGPVAAPMGPAVDAGLTALAGAARADVLDERWVVAPDVTEERFGRPGAPDPAVIRLAQGGGLRRRVPVDTATAALVSVCDGELTARQALGAIAALLAEDASALVERQRPILRRLVEQGFLHRAAG